jgi:radical SAM protein with 4Fe4S-binding SPASM domain
MWSGSVINTQGQVLPCCFDKSSQYSFGNIQENTFQNNWQNEKAMDFRANILQNRKQFEMCRNCTEK